MKNSEKNKILTRSVKGQQCRSLGRMQTTPAPKMNPSWGYLPQADLLNPYMCCVKWLCKMV